MSGVLRGCVQRVLVGKDLFVTGTQVAAPHRQTMADKR